MIVAESFGAIYKRNAINSGFPILTFEPGTQFPSHLSIVNVDLETGRMQTDGESIALNPFSPVQRDIYLAGGLLKTVPGT
jgi:3-isopropylmalate/(R)-2-methylmalate dehydratase small subunit